MDYALWIKGPSEEELVCLYRLLSRRAKECYPQAWMGGAQPNTGESESSEIKWVIYAFPGAPPPGNAPLSIYRASPDYPISLR